MRCYDELSRGEIALKVVFLNLGATGVADGR
jgi:hypothetical protein